MINLFAEASFFLSIHADDDLTSSVSNLGINNLVRMQNFPKSNISYTLIHIRTCTYQGVGIVSFYKEFCAWSLTKNTMLQSCIQNLVEWIFFCKNSSRAKLVNCFYKELHLRYLTEFYKTFCFIFWLNPLSASGALI